MAIFKLEGIIYFNARNIDDALYQLSAHFYELKKRGTDGEDYNLKGTNVSIRKLDDKEKEQYYGKIHVNSVINRKENYYIEEKI